LHHNGGEVEIKLEKFLEEMKMAEVGASEYENSHARTSSTIPRDTNPPKASSSASTGIPVHVDIEDSGVFPSK
jgi:hypothetical protein